MSSIHRRRPVIRLLSLVAVITATLAGPLSATGHAADATVTATGRFVYTDEQGNTVGIKNARVELCDEDFFPIGCTSMGAAETDANGFYSVSGTAGDLFFDLPDPVVKVIANGPSGVVQTGGAVNSTYCFQSGMHDNATNGQTVNFGTLSVDDGISCDISHVATDADDGAWEIYNDLRDGWDFTNAFSQATPGRAVPKVRAFWPDFGTFYRGPIPAVDDGGISLEQNDAFNEAIVMHEYGHHIMQHFAESPIPDYANGNCDGFFFFEAGHCFWQSEKGSVHWTEGWPDFFAQVVTSTLNKDSTIENNFGIENPPHPHPDSDFEHTEGYTAAILWDLFDAVNTSEDHDSNGSRDRLNEAFGVSWRVLVSFDPKPFDPSYNHARTIHEFWQGFAAMNPDLANRLSEIYDENHLAGKPAADLVVSALAEPPASIVRGNSFSGSDTTRNAGSVRTGETSATRYYLSLDQSSGGGDVLVGQRSVPNLLPAGGQHSAGVTLGVPASTAPNTYFLLACADDPRTLFESNDANNCRSSVGQVAVKPEMPDLVEGALSGVPGSQPRGTAFTVTDSAQNAGNATSGSSTTRYYLSSDAIRNAADVRLRGSRSVPVLAAGATSSGSASVEIPGATKVGVYRVLACADDLAAITESNESNNCTASNATVRVTAPDLEVSALTNPPTSARRNGSFLVQDTTSNIGLAPAGASVTRYYLSTDTTKGAGDVQLSGSRSVASLAPGSTSTGTVKVTVPVTTPLGRYFLLACADSTKLVRESNEKNNCISSAFQVRVRTT